MIDRPEFVEHVGKALSRLYDYAFLQTSPLTAYLPAGADTKSRGQALRRALLEAVEGLRPPEGTPSEHSAWRPYRVLEGRYVAGLTLGEVCEELNLGKSQMYREHARAIEALASILWSRWRAEDAAEQRPLPDHTPLHTEVAELTRHEPPENLDVCATLRDVAQLLAPTFEAKSALLTITLPAEPLWVHAGPSMLRYSLLAPLSAAVRWLEAGSVQLCARRTGDQIQIDVTAQGPMTTEGRDAAGSETVKPFVEALGGTVVCGPQSFCLHLPALGATKQLLLVDNNAEMATLFERYLEGEPWALVYAPTVEEALSTCQAHPPSLILLDVLMPGQDGWHFLATLRRSAALSHIPVAICSVLNEPSLALSLGADAYLQKPVSRQQLCELVRCFSSPSAPSLTSDRETWPPRSREAGE